MPTLRYIKTQPSNAFVKEDNKRERSKSEPRPPEVVNIKILQDELQDGFIEDEIVKRVGRLSIDPLKQASIKKSNVNDSKEISEKENMGHASFTHLRSPTKSPHPKATKHCEYQKASMTRADMMKMVSPIVTDASTLFKKDSIGTSNLQLEQKVHPSQKNPVPYHPGSVNPPYGAYLGNYTRRQDMTPQPNFSASGDTPEMGQYHHPSGYEQPNYPHGTAAATVAPSQVNTEGCRKSDLTKKAQTGLQGTKRMPVLVNGIVAYPKPRSNDLVDPTEAAKDSAKSLEIKALDPKVNEAAPVPANVAKALIPQESCHSQKAKSQIGLSPNSQGKLIVKSLLSCPITDLSRRGLSEAELTLANAFNSTLKSKAENVSATKQTITGSDTVRTAPTVTFVLPSHTARTKTKKVKDPNAPRKAKSAYTMYKVEIWPIIKKEFPGISFGEICKLAGERWRNLEPAHKEKFVAMAYADKRRYHVDYAKYMESLAEGSVDPNAV